MCRSPRSQLRTPPTSDRGLPAGESVFGCGDPTDRGADATGSFVSFDAMAGTFPSTSGRSIGVAAPPSLDEAVLEFPAPVRAGREAIRGALESTCRPILLRTCPLYTDPRFAFRRALPPPGLLFCPTPWVLAIRAGTEVAACLSPRSGRVGRESSAPDRRGPRAHAKPVGRARCRREGSSYSGSDREVAAGQARAARSTHRAACRGGSIPPRAFRATSCARDQRESHGDNAGAAARARAD